MIDQKTIVRVKPQNHNAVVEMLKVAREGLENPNSMRILTSLIGVSYTTVLYELTNESLEENRTGWGEWYSKPENMEFMEKWFEILEDTNDEYYMVEN